MLGKTLKKFNAFLLAITVIILQFGIIKAFAVTYPAYAVIGNDSKGYTTASVYSKAGTTGHEVEGEKNTSEYIETLTKGTKVKLLSHALDGDNDLWYKVAYGDNYSKEGYVYELRITIIGSYTEDAEFEKWLTDQGFPETYKDSLRDLHSLYPAWVFYADHINLEWSEVAAAESETGKKLVHKSWADSWKSLEPDAYDEKTNTWYEFDSGGWVAASKMVVEYYTDPRNFLDSKSIFMFSSHSYDEKYDTKDNLMLMIKGKFLDTELPDDVGRTYADAIMNAAKTANVSPFAIASTILQEQGNDGGGGNISGDIEGYTGYYNFFNIGAYAAGSMTAVQRGLWYASGEPDSAGNITNTSYNRPWNTREKSIIGGAQWYGGSYVSSGQNTYYYMNFDVISDGGLYNHQYATNVKDSVSKATFLSGAYSEVMDSSLVFHIPVYKNMPELTRLPEETGNNDNFLFSLGVTGYKIYGFNKYITEYELIVDSAAESIEITAVANSTLATVSGTGTKALNTGNNEFEITVTASSGEARIYKLTVNRPPSGGEPPAVPDPTINGSYKIGDYITGVATGTAVGDFITKLGVSNGTAKVFDKNSAEKTSGNIATGDTVKVYNNSGAEKISHIVLIYGDTNGDGIISAIDLATVKMLILKKYELSGVYLNAANPSKTGSVNASDLAMVKMTILNKYTIQQ